MRVEASFRPRKENNLLLKGEEGQESPNRTLLPGTLVWPLPASVDAL